MITGLQPTRGKVSVTRTWRIVSYEAAAQPLGRLYLALSPEALESGYGAAYPILEAHGLNHRHALSPVVLREMDRHPAWAGKAVVIDLPDHGQVDRLADELDRGLAELSLSGPPVLASARPFGGRSGLVFVRCDDLPDATRPDARRQRLSRLLGG